MFFSKTKAKTLDELYADRKLFTSQDMFSPPSERRPHVIRFELTTGCNYGRCTYCGGFDGIRHHMKSFEEFKDHVNTVWSSMAPDLKKGFRRIFIGGGNGLEVPNEDLKKALTYTVKKFSYQAGFYPARTSMYGRTDSIIEKGRAGLSELHYSHKLSSGLHNGLDLIYWGVESGSDEVLQYVDKGCTNMDLMRAAEEVRSNVVDTSIMIMPGLGGIRFYDQHVRETVGVINAIHPRFLTFMGVNPSTNSAYSRRMESEEQEETNRPLTPYELATQMIDMIRGINCRVKVGCFDRSVDAVGDNPLTFGSVRLYSQYDAKALANRLEGNWVYDDLRRIDRRLRIH